MARRCRDWQWDTIYRWQDYGDMAMHFFDSLAVSFTESVIQTFF